MIVESASQREISFTLSRATQIFRERLSDTPLQKSAKASISLSVFVADNTDGAVSRRDAALAFLQTLVLKTLVRPRFRLDIQIAY